MNDNNNQGGVAVEGQEQVQQGQRQIVDLQLADSKALQLEATSLVIIADEVLDGAKNVLGGLTKAFETRSPVAIQAAIDQYTTLLNQKVVGYANRLASLNTKDNRNINTTLQTKDGRVSANLGRIVQAILPDPMRQHLRAAIKKGSYVA